LEIVAAGVEKVDVELLIQELDKKE